MKNTTLAMFAAGFLAFLLGALPVQAQPVQLTTFTIDEFGNLQLQSPTTNAIIPGAGTVQEDPSETFDEALVFTLGDQLAPGDVAIIEPPQGGLSDVIRFFPGVVGNQPVTFIIFYSDTDPGDPSPVPADVGVPDVAGAVQIPEDANGLAFYTPLPGQPGFYLEGTSETQLSYVFMSEGNLAPVPEPASMLGLVLGVGAAIVRKRRTL